MKPDHRKIEIGMGEVEVIKDISIIENDLS
jgi:hypothetical protein